jgi:uncharacterized membrane protein YkvA (DUF1232 family)
MKRLLRDVWRGNSRAELLRLAAHLPTYVKLLWGLYKDERVPLHSKGMLLAALGYLLSPVDLIPDFIPGLGQIDDVVLFLLVWQIFKSQCPKEVWEEHLARIRLGESDFDRDFARLKERASGLVEYMERNLDQILRRFGRLGEGGRHQE